VRLVREAARRAQADAPTPTRLAVISAADPVDRSSGRLVHLPDAPFLLGDLSPVEALASLTDGPIKVDNDVNWAARAERRDGQNAWPDDFAYLHLGEGLGCAVVSDGEVRLGHGGIAGEIAHVLTRGPDGRATYFTDVFAGLDLRHPGSTAIDSDALVRAVEGDGADRLRADLAAAVGGVLAAVVAIADPELIVIGGTWGTHPAVIEGIRGEFARHPRHVPIRPAQVTVEPSLAGARHQALHDLRDVILARLVRTAPAR
jgi:predicted NBD/HSP70 family sugar kinase